MAPPGTRVIAHTKPKQRQSFGYYGQDAFYIGPALEHYRCVQCYVPLTRHVMIEDTVQFFPNKIKFPTITLNDHLLTAIQDIISILNNSKFQMNNATLHFSDETKMTLKIVTDILQTIATKPELPPPSPFLHQVQATLNNMSKNFNTPNHKNDNLPIIPSNDDVPLPRVVPLKNTTSDKQVHPSPNKHYQCHNHTNFKNNALKLKR